MAILDSPDRMSGICPLKHEKFLQLIERGLGYHFGITVHKIIFKVMDFVDLKLKVFDFPIMLTLKLKLLPLVLDINGIVVPFN